ncbi:maternal protein exuperantia-1 [Macrosteles quadrilineatus]|uniref:maternal protein exuperantia-1 n=1 Tax=Macrosteles quadrilineatus TaxID=74068 RepID=UPI0023E30D3F|nr:maternal protein exuperantia-1 [Macrosteles quadrilineatus]XP_054278663.1 maternal protein exuperantia-1 [Macrosteles quadrilineatus]
MVSTDVAKKAGLPAGEYKIVAWDLDTTGRRLIDEFCHVAGYTPDSKFSQYVMPYRDLDLISKRRHQVRTVTVGRYRMLKDLKTGKFLKTKSEISALVDFLQWLEKTKAEGGPGIILLNYETYKLAPSLLLEALKKYQLLDRFREVVKGFGDCYAFVKQKCEATLNSFSLKVVSKVLLDRDDETSTALERAKLAYEIVQHLTAGESAGEEDAAGLKIMVEAIREHTSTIDEELQVIEDMKVVLQRQNTLRPVFAPIMRKGIQERKSASALRRLLTGALLDYDTLMALWAEGREKFEETVTSKLSEASEEQRKELVKLLSDHFDPDVTQPEEEKKPRNPRKGTRKSHRESNAKDKEPATSSDIPSTPDTTASNTEPSSPSKSNGLTTPQDDSPKHEAAANGAK